MTWSSTRSFVGATDSRATPSVALACQVDQAAENPLAVHAEIVVLVLVREPGHALRTCDAVSVENPRSTYMSLAYMAAATET